MEARSGSIKEPIYYPTGADSLTSEIDQGSRSSAGSSTELGLDEGSSLKVPRKFIVNWRQACDRTRDRTKDLLKKWRTVPSHVEESTDLQITAARESDHPSWSVHVWTTWVSRYPSNDSLSAIEFPEKDASKSLAPIQRDKLSHFFENLLDHDRDGFVTRKDFSIFSERLRRFADWSFNGPEYLRLLEIEHGFAELVLRDRTGRIDDSLRIDLSDWLNWWARIIAPPTGASYNDLPYWIKLLPKIFFHVINSSGSGRISKKELANFYTSVVNFDLERTEKCLDTAYDSMTSNGDHPLGWPQYKLVFANFLFARGPFGPGEHFLGMTDSCLIRGNSVPFPIDYSAMNTPKDKLEVYSPHRKTSRRSVIV